MTSRPQQGLRLLLAVTAGPLCVGIVVGLVDALRAGDPGAPFGRTGWGPLVGVGWVVALSLLVAMSGALAVLWRTEVRLTPYGVSRRVLLGRRETGLQDLRRVVARGAVTHGATGPRPASLSFVDREGRTVGAVRPTETAFAEALGVVRGWVERRPDLVQDEDTAAVLGLAGPPAGR